jgi:ferredoxin
MAYVITDACIDVKDQTCVQECPVDCIETTDADKQYFIDPDICIDCGACQPVCPVNAIFPSDEVPPEQQHQIQKNADFFTKKKAQQT